MKVSLVNEKAAILAANYLRAVHTCDVSDAIARELRQNFESMPRKQNASLASG